jgi:hypothetical protein
MIRHHHHLTQPKDRLTALHEGGRILQGGGLLWGAGISRFTSLLDSLSSGFFDQPEFVPILERDLAEGQHRNPTDNPNYFTDAVFHLPDELAGELADAGFELVVLVAVEGPGWLAQAFAGRCDVPEQPERLLAVLRRVEHDRPDRRQLPSSRRWTKEVGPSSKAESATVIDQAHGYSSKYVP